MRSTVVDGSIDPLISPDQAAPVFLNIFTNPYIAGIVYAGLFAAIMSTADAFINIGVAAITHDIPKSIKGSPLNNDLFWARIGTISLCIIASIFATFSWQTGHISTCIETARLKEALNDAEQYSVSSVSLG